MVAITRRDWWVWWGTQWRDGLGFAVGLFVSLRLAFALISLLEVMFAPVYAPCTAAAPTPILHQQGIALWGLGVWQRADGCMYEWIASDGYQPDDPFQLAFFPLYPLLIRLARPLLGGNLTLSALFISGLSFIAAITGLYRLTSRDFDQHVARRAVLYLSLFPSAFFLFAPFTEALFLALSVWALYSARREWWLWAGVLAGLAALTRTQGVFLALPLAWEVIRQYRLQRTKHHPSWQMFIVPLAPIGGFLAYNSFTLYSAGLTVMQAQRVWGMETQLPWKVIADSVRYIRERGSPIEATNLFLLLTCAVVIAFGLRQVPLSYTLVCLPQLLVLMTRETYHSPLMSVSRLLLVLFPIFVVLALLGRRQWLHRTWLSVSVALLVLLLFIFLGGPFVA